MASKLRPPEELSFAESLHLAEKWRMWKQEMELYLDLTMKSSTEKDKCSAFLYIIGRTGREIYNTWTIPEDEKDKIETLFARFEAYCKPKHNVTLERYRFNSRVQQEGESLDEFITDLKKMSLMCDYNQLQSEMIRDRLVVGIKKTAVKERLLREPELTLETAISICRADEESQKGLTLMNSDQTTLHAVKSKPSRPATNTQSYPPRKNTTGLFNPKTTFLCKSCGYPHGPNACPAFGKTCRVCAKKNHFAKQCRSALTRNRVIGACAQSSSDEDEPHQNYFMGAVGNITDTGTTKDWNVVLNCRGKDISFKLDTGAQANVISESLVKEVNGKTSPTSARLTAYSGDKIPVLGETIIPCIHKGKTYNIKFIVASAPSAQSILGLRACESMKLIQKVYQLTSPCQPDQCSSTGQVKALVKEYSDTFGELGCVQDTHQIQLDPNITPVVVASRRVPLALRDKLDKELERMERMGVIAKVNEPTDWVNPMILVEKANGSLRVCMDPKKLNEAIKREHYQLPTLDEVITEMRGAKFFTKLDASSGFWAVQLDDRSSRICTFATPSGRYRFLRLPFGIKSAPEVFQKVMHKHFGDLEGVVSYEDDLCIWSESIEEHMVRLRRVFERARKCGIKFNRSKCAFLQKELKYLGHILTEQGVKADPDKIKAITCMPAPEDKQGLMRFLGMVTYLTKFVPNTSDKTSPLRELLQDDVPWQWLPQHENCFQEIKKTLTTSPVLAYFDPKKKVLITADACRNGLGAALLQDNRVVAYASRAMTSAETRYAMIEKEMLAIVFALERFHQYSYGRPVVVETDHKPLVAIHTKEFLKCPARIQRFMLRLQAYDVTIQYKKGTEQVLSDTLSRAVDKDAEVSPEVPKDDMAAYINIIVSQISASPKKLDEIRQNQKTDERCIVLRDLILNGWPDSPKKVQRLAQPFWTFREELTICEDLLMKGQQLIIPKKMESEMLQRAHEGHFGMEITKERARSHMFWPGISKDIEDMVAKCSTCQTYRKSQQRLPLQSHDIPEQPFHKVGADLFHFATQNYLLVVDYTSKFFEVSLLRDTTSITVIQHMKSIFARYGIPIQLVTDNGPQFTSTAFKNFCRDWEISHTTSSPLYPRSNGLAERTVQTVKGILKKARHAGQDPYLSLLNFRTTKKPDQLSPAEVLMGRKPRTLLPTVSGEPTTAVNKQVINERRRRQKHYYDVHTRQQKTLNPDDTVRYRNHSTRTWEPARVLSQAGPRSYHIQTKSGALRRNRQDILQSGEPPHDLTPDPIETESTLRQDSSQPSSSGQMPCGDDVRPVPTPTPKTMLPSMVAQRAEQKSSPITSSKTMLPSMVAQRAEQKFSPISSPRDTQSRADIPTTRTTRSGRVVKMPNRYND